MVLRRYLRDLRILPRDSSLLLWEANRQHHRNAPGLDFTQSWGLINIARCCSLWELAKTTATTNFSWRASTSNCSSSQHLLCMLGYLGRGCLGNEQRLLYWEVKGDMHPFVKVALSVSVVQIGYHPISSTHAPITFPWHVLRPVPTTNAVIACKVEERGVHN